MNKLLQGQALKQRAIELGVSTHELATNSGIESEPLLQERVMNAERHIREHKLWIVAVVSAIIAFISMVVTLWAVA